MCVTVIIIRYAEIALKSTPVRLRFENLLKDNMFAMLMADGVESLVTKGEARFYVEATDIQKAVRSLRKVFGVASISVSETTTADMDDMCSLAAEYSLSRLSEGQSFAVKARREGTHTYTSVDLGREIGSAIFLANEHKDVKVDLTNPDVVFFVEVRNNHSYIFDEYVRCHAGLPLGSQGKVIADLDNDRGLVAAWLMMKRGCRVLANGTHMIDLLGAYDPNMRQYSGDFHQKEILGHVTSYSLDNFVDGDYSGEVPIFFPTIGMTDEDVNKILSQMQIESKV